MNGVLGIRKSVTVHIIEHRFKPGGQFIGNEHIITIFGRFGNETAVAVPAVETEAGFCVRLKIIHGEIILKPHGAVHITAGLCFKVNIELPVPLAVVVPANFGKFVAGRVKLKQLFAVRKIENAGNIVAGNIQPFQCFAAGRIDFGKAAVIGGNVHKVGI